MEINGDKHQLDIAHISSLVSMFTVKFSWKDVQLMCMPLCLARNADDHFAKWTFCLQFTYLMEFQER